MTIEQLLECKVEELEAMTDEQITDHFRPMFCVTRPTEGTRKVLAKPQTRLDKLNQIVAAAENAKKFNVDIAALFKNI